MPELPEIDQRLIDILVQAGEEWGPTGVARAARMLAAVQVGVQPAPEQPTHHTNDCDLLIRHRACSCGYAPDPVKDARAQAAVIAGLRADPFGRSADQ